MNTSNPSAPGDPAVRIRDFLVRRAGQPDLNFEDWLARQPHPRTGLRRSYAEWQLVRRFGELGRELIAPLDHEGPRNQAARSEPASWPDANGRASSEGS